MLHKARSSSSGLKQQYQVRRKKLIEDRAKLLQEKQASLLCLRKKKVREKENLTKAVMKFGLWQNEQHVVDGLAKLKSKTSKLHALKVQLDFRQKVLEQCPTDKSIFHLSKRKKTVCRRSLQQPAQTFFATF